MATDKKDVPAVSVLVLACGDYSGLAGTVDSVLCQTCRVTRLILSDDGSGKPFPEEIAERLRRAFPEKGRLVIRQGAENLGTVVHMNALARLTDTPWLKFIGSGDRFSDAEALESLLRFAAKQDAMAVTSQSQICDQTLRPLYQFPGRRRGKVFDRSPGDVFKILAKTNVVSAVGTLLHRRFFAEYGGFDERYRLLEDWPAWLRLTREGHALPLLNRVTCLYTLGGVSSQNANAFCAPALVPDMRLCYEQEILPYLAQFDEKTVRQIRYGYDRLLGMPLEELRRHYGLLEQKTRWKKRIKVWMSRR